MAQNKHRNDENTIFNGNPPEIEKLYNGRYRFTFRCQRDNNNDGWYYENRENLFAEFGDLSQAPYAKQGKGVTPPTGQTWPDLRLVQHGWVFIPQIDVPLLQFVYETITDTYVEDRKETVDYELNGLRRVTRTLIAKEGTTYGKTVGTDTISHTALGYAAETLYLASVDDVDLDDDEGGFTRIRETWVQAGTLRESEQTRGIGWVEVSKTFLQVEETFDGPIVARSEDNVEGLKTITVTRMQNGSGGSLVGTTTFSDDQNFTFPGLVGYDTRSFGGFIDYYLKTLPPITKLIRVTNTVSYSTDSSQTITNRYDPGRWVGVELVGIGTGDPQPPITDTISYSGYCLSGSSVTTPTQPIDGSPIYLMQGRRLYGGTSGKITFKTGGSSNYPTGTKTISASTEAIFTATDGTVYYRHVKTEANLGTQPSF